MSRGVFRADHVGGLRPRPLLDARAKFENEISLAARCFLSRGKMVAPRLMSSKHAAVEDQDAVKRRTEEAARYAPLDQLALSHQCGFSSTVHGNDLSEADQWKKPGRMVAIAGEVWG